MTKNYLMYLAAFVCAFSTCYNDNLLADIDSEQAPTTVAQEKDDPRLNALLSTPEGIILFWGWYEAEENGFDPSVLTEKEKEAFIAKGLFSLSEKVENGDEYSRIHSNTLARYYFLKKDNKKSLYWSFKGADNGCAGCMLLLSESYRSGRGVVQDLEESIKWKYLGAALGNEFCNQWVTENGVKGLLNKETATIIREGQKRANQWMKEHPELFISAE